MFLEKARKFNPLSSEHILLSFILAGGALLRISGIGWGLPYMLHPDECQVVYVYLSMVKSHTLNPHSYVYPGLLFYINSFFYLIYFLARFFLGSFHSSKDIAFPQMLIIGTGIIKDPNIFYLGRAISIVAGIGTIFLVYRCAKEISGKARIGLLAAAFTAVSNANVVESHLIYPNILVAFFATLTIWFSLQIFKTGQTRYYLLAGLAVGLTASSKYNGAVVAAAVVAAHFLRAGKKGWKDTHIYLAALLSGIVFLTINPYSVLDFNNFYKQFIMARDSYVLGWPGFADLPIAWYSTYLLQFEGIVAIAALGGLLWAIWKRQPYFIIGGIFPLLYLITLSLMKYYNEHTILHLLPAVHIIGACFLGVLIEIWLARPAGKAVFGRAAAILLILFAIALPLWKSIAVGATYILPDSRTTARIWIEQNIPQGSRIALESYSPYVDPKKYDAVGVAGFLPQNLAWYRENHFQYLIFSQGMYGRYYANPGQFGSEIETYEKLFRSLYPVKIFNDGGYEIRIYQLKSP